MVWQTNVVYAAIFEHSLKKNKAVKEKEKKYIYIISSKAQQEMQQCGEERKVFLSF